MDDKQTPYPLLAKYFAKQCTDAEREEVAYWRRESPGNEALFVKLSKQWEGARREHVTYVIPDKEVVWKKVKARVVQKAKQLPLYSRARLIRVGSIAATVALILGFSLSLLLFQSGELLVGPVYEHVVLAPSGQKSKLILPDGTSVWLNSGSRLTYNTRYNLSERTVVLEGEAFFEVKPDKQIPFIVKAGEVDVQVHGTAFNVNAYAADPDIAVSLLRGSVSVLVAADRHVLTYLEPDQSAIVSRHNLNYRVQTCDAEVEASWHLNKLKLEGVPAGEIWKKLERWYGVQIAVSDNVPDNKYWITLKTESLTDLLEVINKLTPIDYTLNGEEVTVRYK